MNVRIVVKENTLIISAVVNSSPANHLACSSRESSSFSTFLNLASIFFTDWVIYG